MRWLTRRRKPAETLRYYVYVSDSKVDMLFSQIPKSFLDRVAGELKVDLKILAVSLTENPSEENRYTKLRLVEKFLEQNFDIGTVDQPTPYFRGALSMRWGEVGVDPTRIAFFWGISQQTLIG